MLWVPKMTKWMQIAKKHKAEYLIEDNIEGSNGVSSDSEVANCLLIKACSRGRIEDVKELVSKGAQVDCSFDDGYTPLHWAATNGHLSVAKYLVEEAGATVTCYSTDGMTPLMAASCSGNVSVVELLISNGASPSETNVIGADVWTMTLAIEPYRTKIYGVYIKSRFLPDQYSTRHWTVNLENDFFST